jgi:hypothetical protein
MEYTVVNGEVIVDKFDMIMGLLSAGFTIGIVIFVIVAAARVGWKLAPWVLGLGFLAWLFF